MKQPRKPRAWGVTATSEPRWPASLAIVVCAALNFVLPGKFTMGPAWLVPVLEGAILVPLSIVALGTLTFCAPREPAGMGKGILLSVFYPQPPPAGLTLSVTLFQEGATAYAPPVLCDVSGC